MIIYNGIKYATSDSEMVDSLFNDGEGTLEELKKIKVKKNDVKYYTSDDSGFGFNRFGVPFKFCKCSDGKTRYFYTLDADKEAFEQEHKKYF